METDRAANHHNVTKAQTASLKMKEVYRQLLVPKDFVGHLQEALKLRNGAENPAPQTDELTIPTAKGIPAIVQEEVLDDAVGKEVEPNDAVEPEEMPDDAMENEEVPDDAVGREDDPENDTVENEEGPDDAVEPEADPDVAAYDDEVDTDPCQPVVSSSDSSIQSSVLPKCSSELIGTNLQMRKFCNVNGVFAPAVVPKFPEDNDFEQALINAILINGWPPGVKPPPGRKIDRPPKSEKSKASIGEPARHSFETIAGPPVCNRQPLDDLTEAYANFLGNRKASNAEPGKVKVVNRKKPGFGTVTPFFRYRFVKASYQIGEAEAGRNDDENRPPKHPNLETLDNVVKSGLITARRTQHF